MLLKVARMLVKALTQVLKVEIVDLQIMQRKTILMIKKKRKKKLSLTIKKMKKKMMMKKKKKINMLY